jgi:hypothetical protein
MIGVCSAKIPRIYWGDGLCKPRSAASRRSSPGIAGWPLPTTWLTGRQTCGLRSSPPPRRRARWLDASSSCPHHFSLVAGAQFDRVKGQERDLDTANRIKAISEALRNARHFTLVMPGNIQNLLFGFESKGSSMLSVLSDCIKQNGKNTRTPNHRLRMYRIRSRNSSEG